MKMKRFGETEQTVYDLVKPITDELGYDLWDVSYEKEGAYWYLRIYIDHADGIDIEDCERATRPINAAIDRADPISEAYILEVGSAGLERALNTPAHLESSLGFDVRARAVRPVEGEREWIGQLLAYDEASVCIRLRETEQEKRLLLSDLSYIRRYIDVEFS